MISAADKCDGGAMKDGRENGGGKKWDRWAEKNWGGSTPERKSRLECQKG